MDLAAQMDAMGDLFEGTACGHLATLMPGGGPQVTPVWFERRGGELLVASYVGRVKDRNIRRDPRVALEISDPANPYRFATVQGKVVEITEEGAAVLLDELSQRYIGQTPYPWRKPGQVSVLYRIRPTKVHLHEPLG